MVKDAETILRQQPTNCLSVFDHFGGLAHKGLKLSSKQLLLKWKYSELPNFKQCNMLEEMKMYAMNLPKIFDIYKDIYIYQIFLNFKHMTRT